MSRHRAIWLTIGLLVLASLACNAFAGNREPTVPPLPTGEGNVTPGADDGTDTDIILAPTSTLSGEGTAVGQTPSAAGPTATVLVDLNVRSGPGVQYDIVGFLLQNSSVPIVGQDPEGEWWKIECPSRATGPECWISGGAQYSRAADAGGVPVAAVPATPTPASPKPAPGVGQLTYIDNGRLWSVALDLNQTPPTAGEPQQLVDSGNVQDASISPDGRRIAYKIGNFEENALYVANINGSNARVLVTSDDLPVAGEGDPADVAVLVDKLQWLEDSQTLAFNTSVVNLVGPGAASQEDLWTVTLDGTLTERFEAQTAGGDFAISADNIVILSQPGQIVRANLDGSDSRVLITFPFINTASEYIYYPQPQWTTANSDAYLAIPSQEPFSADASATLWHIPASGAAEILETIPGNILFDPVVWSPEGSVLAYVYRDMAADNPPPVLRVANGSGQSLADYATGERLTFYGWSTNEHNFLYAAAGYYAIGEIGKTGKEIALPAGQQMVGGKWITADTFVIVTGSNNTWTLSSGNTTGAQRTLITVSGDSVQFDAWTP